MTIAYMNPMLKKARTGKYGIVAFNMNDYNSTATLIRHLDLSNLQPLLE
ncbi:MAG: hypothetical protein HOH05_05630 [Marinovum sp.]|jgi:fructose/tagatose bisphosphate aldolase|nr:hypothetical protein [Marinovum sp.]MBT6526790.1 hypothetical protein [Marinovum sp.]